MHKKKFILLLGILSTIQLAGQPNYSEYYKSINSADSLIYISNEYKKGSEIYLNIFSRYDFVWVEDCLRLCQVALVAKDTNTAKICIYKAFENGFELGSIRYINQGCPCTFFKDYNQKVSILNGFINNNFIEFYNKYKELRHQYLRKIDTSLLVEIIERHIADEFWKVEKIDFKISSKKFADKRKDVKEENYIFIKNCFENGRFFGALNLGYYTESMMMDLGIGNKSIECIKEKYYEKYNLKEDSSGRGYRIIPSCTDDYLQNGSPLFYIYYHDDKLFFSLMTNYYNDLISKGYLHPREYALLSHNLRKGCQGICVRQNDFDKCESHNIIVNPIRASYFLPSIEIENAKHRFMHKHGLQLYFGQFNYTR